MKRVSRRRCARRRAPVVALASGMLVALACDREQPTPDQAFWSWFEANAGRLRWVRSDIRNELADEIAAELAKVAPGLDFEVEGEPGEERRLIVSANGRRDRLEVVAGLVAAAPTLDRWTVTAFRPRIGAGYDIEYRGFLLEPGELWFEPLDAVDGRLGLRLFLPGIGSGRHQLAVEAADLMIHAVLGEYAALTRLGRREHRTLPPEPGAQGLRPIADLPALVDALPGPETPASP